MLKLSVGFIKFPQMNLKIHYNITVYDITRWMWISPGYRHVENLHNQMGRGRGRAKAGDTNVTQCTRVRKSGGPCPIMSL